MIARHGVQLPLHYIHFKIEKFSRSDDGVFSLYKGFVDPIVSRIVESCKVAKVVFFFIFLQIAWFPWRSDWLFILVKLSHWLGKRCDLEQKMMRIVNKSHQWEPIRFQGSLVISKWMQLKNKKTPGKGDRCEILNETAVKLLCPAEWWSEHGADPWVGCPSFTVKIFNSSFWIL